MANNREAQGVLTADSPRGQNVMTAATRTFGWIVVATTLVFLLNNYLEFWQGWPGIAAMFSYLGLAAPLKTPLTAGAAVLGWLQLLSYAACLVGPAVFVHRRTDRGLRQDADAMTGLATYIIRAAFWMVLFVGLADMTISFLRVENLLPSVVGTDLAQALGRSQFRGAYVHLPLIGAALIVAALSRSLGFYWLALLVVIAELVIVITRFVFSYEQAFMGDLVRFWYAALFLFASAYTLLEEGHVRVDVLYANFNQRQKGRVNAIGSVLLGIVLCWVILAIGMGGKANIINSPLLAWEVSQSGFGLYVKYLMAAFLAIYAVSMMIQFASQLLSSVADYLGDPGGRLNEPEAEPAH